MLRSKNLNDKNYEQRFTEAILQIPLYCPEWTNFNPSDPGVTVVENLSAYTALQQNAINAITPAVRQKLLKMVGFEGVKAKPARVLLAPLGATESIMMPANQRFRLGKMCFETNRPLEIGAYRVEGVYGKKKDQLTDFSYLLDRELEVAASVFGDVPAAGDSIYFALNALPAAGEEIIFYFTVADENGRNPFTEKEKDNFAELTWEISTTDGYVEMDVRDTTGGFLVSGEVRMRIPEVVAKGDAELPGAPLAIRATLKRAEYDHKPRLLCVDGFLFEVFQKDTQAAVLTFNKFTRVNCFSDLAEEDYVQVFCKEEKGSSYRKYTEYAGEGAEGRYYIREREGYGMNSFIFSEKQFGYGPSRLKNPVKILFYNEKIMRRYELGRVLGYDNQEFVLPIQNVVADSFSILAERLDENGVPMYDFVRPERYEEDSLCYHLYENEGRISIEDAGAFVGATLYMCGCSITRGADGNVRSNNEFKANGLPENIRFINPGAGTGGSLRETLEQVEARFLKDFRTPYTAVTAGDYERIVMETPSLCIRKVKAVLDNRVNTVKVAVQPGTPGEFPLLSDLYKKLIARQLEERRLLTTRIDIVQPQYVAVNVQAVVYVKSHFENPKNQIEEVIRRQLDYGINGKNFGDVLRFNEVFHAIEALECVEFLYDLSLRPARSDHASLQDADIVPASDALLYPGSINVEINTSYVRG